MFELRTCTLNLWALLFFHGEHKLHLVHPPISFPRLVSWSRGFPLPTCVAQEPCALLLLVALAPYPGVGQESREELVVGLGCRVDTSVLLALVDLEGSLMEVRWDLTLGPAHTAH